MVERGAADKRELIATGRDRRFVRRGVNQMTCGARCSGTVSKQQSARSRAGMGSRRQVT
jgi:hypothetical protein